MQVLAHAVLEHGGVLVLRLQVLLVPRHRELAVVPLEYRRLRNVGTQLIVGDGDAVLESLPDQQALADEAFEHREAQLGAVQHGGVDAAARHVAKLLLPVAQRLLKFLLGDLGVADFRDGRAGRRVPEVRIDAEEGERKDDDPQDDLDDAFVTLYQVEHVASRRARL